MTSHVHYIISKDRYRVALPRDRMHHGELGMNVQYALPWTIPTCIVIMTKAASNVAVGFPAMPIVAMFISFFYYSFIHMCIHCLGHFSPLPPPPLSPPHPPSLPGRTCSALISNFVEEKI
jgi:hypothetical protein